MASNFHIQKPYVLATLPTPLQRQETPGKCSVGVVYGQRPGPKKRTRRSELAIGIDGDAVNLYDVPGSRLITSYPIPPQYFFTCAPCSIRWKASIDEIVRYTYASTEESQTSRRRVTLFKDVVEKAGVTTSTSSFAALRLDSPVVYLTTTPISTPASSSETAALGANKPSFNLLAVTQDGTVVCLDRETLEEKWRASSSAYSGTAKQEHTVELAQTVPATEVIEGFFQGKADLLAGLYNRKIAKESFDPDVLVVITSSQGRRELVTMAVHDGPASQGRVFQVSTANLPQPAEAATGAADYQLHVGSGSIQELCANHIYTYRVEDGAPRLAYTLPVPNASSFLRLSDTSVLTATAANLSIYNPGYRSVQASTPLNLTTDGPAAAKTEDPSAPYQLITYFPRLEVALGIRGSSLFAAQLEAPKTRKRKRRAEGLLIDSIGRGLSHATDDHKWTVPEDTHEIFANYVPGSLSEAYWRNWTEDTAKADEFLRNKQISGFEELLTTKLGALPATKTVNGVPTGSEAEGDAMEVDVSPSEQRPTQVDRRWVLFAISRVFALSSNLSDGLAKPKLSCQLPGSLMADYLISTGYLSVSNVKSAFGSEAREIHEVDALLAEQIPELVASIDPTLELLVEYLTTTRPAAVVLLASIRLIMRSLDLVQDPSKLNQKLISFGGEGETNRETANEEEALGMKLDKLEEDLEVTEYHLLDDSSTRARGLTIAFDLLGSCTALSTVQAIRRLFRPEETLSLMHILRVELVKGGWTARYLDNATLAEGSEEDDAEAPPPDGSIRLIADLLCRCIDSVGAGGWMINDALLARTGDHADSAEFLAGLKLEVSAALEGIQEAVYLRGLLIETVKYGNNLQQALAEAQTKTPYKSAGTPHKGTSYKPGVGAVGTPFKAGERGERERERGSVVTPGGMVRRNKPQTFSADPREMRMLPLGLGSKTRISATKVVAGGEVASRSKREMGLLVSQRVGAYSLERIVV